MSTYLLIMTVSILQLYVQFYDLWCLDYSQDYYNLIVNKCDPQLLKYGGRVQIALSKAMALYFMCIPWPLSNWMWVLQLMMKDGSWSGKEQVSLDSDKETGHQLGLHRIPQVNRFGFCIKPSRRKWGRYNVSSEKCLSPLRRKLNRGSSGRGWQCSSEACARGFL